MYDMDLKVDFESMYFELIGKVADIQEFLMYADRSNEIIADTEIMLKNIIEKSEENYISCKEKMCAVC